MISLYLSQPESARVAAFDDALGITSETTAEQLEGILANFYRETKLTDTDIRLSWLTAKPADFENSKDPFSLWRQPLGPTTHVHV